jgi:hypothetical protein
VCCNVTILLVKWVMPGPSTYTHQHVPTPPTQPQSLNRRSATEALKIVGESYPWTAAPGWQPHRRVPPGGINETTPVHFGQCGEYRPSTVAQEHSTFVYLRSNHKVRLGWSSTAGVQRPCTQPWKTHQDYALHLASHLALHTKCELGSGFGWGQGSYTVWRLPASRATRAREFGR